MHPRLSLFQSAPLMHGDWAERGTQGRVLWDVQAFRWQNKAGFAGCLTVMSPGFSSALLRLRYPSKSAKSPLSAKNLARLPSASFPSWGGWPCRQLPSPRPVQAWGWGERQGELDVPIHFEAS